MARLITLKEAISENIPKNLDPGPYRLGIGDSISISQRVDVPLNSLQNNSNRDTTREYCNSEDFIHC